MKILLIFLLILPLSIFAAEPREIAETFLASLQKGDFSVGYHRLFANSGMQEAKPQTLDVIKTQTQSLLPLYGKIPGYEFIKEDKYGTSLVRLTYIVKSERFPTVWVFHFYKPKTVWFTANVDYSDHFDILK